MFVSMAIFLKRFLLFEAYSLGLLFSHFIICQRDDTFNDDMCMLEHPKLCSGDLRHCLLWLRYDGQ